MLNAEGPGRIVTRGVGSLGFAIVVGGDFGR